MFPGLNGVDQIDKASKAQSAGEVVRLGEVLRDKPDRVVTVPPTASAAEAAARMQAEGVGAVLVCVDGRHVLGVLSERDLALAAAAFGREIFDLCAGELMTADAPTAGPTDAVRSILHVMTERRAQHVTVLEDGVVTGVVSLGDLLKSRLAEMALESAG
jgi:signal-transduction protein with cAMP-binding, CBS, and nucleotidyltransferase domain